MTLVTLTGVIPGRPPSWLISLERALADDEDTEQLATALVVLASIAGSELDLDPDEVHAASRRAVLLLAAGGDPARGLDLNGRAVSALALDLDEPHRRSVLAIGLERLRGETAGMQRVSAIVQELAREPEIAWRAFACSLLAEELGSD